MKITIDITPEEALQLAQGNAEIVREITTAVTREVMANAPKATTDVLAAWGNMMTADWIKGPYK